MVSSEECSISFLSFIQHYPQVAENSYRLKKYSVKEEGTNVRASWEGYKGGDWFKGGENTLFNLVCSFWDNSKYKDEELVPEQQYQW